MLNPQMMPFQGNPMKRKTRTPSFPVAGTMEPFGLYPFFAHPVLPGETLQSLSSKVRTISMPVKYPLGGAWLETWFVYVKMTDISAELAQSFVDESLAPTDTFEAPWGGSGATITMNQTSNAPRYFIKTGHVKWLPWATSRFHAAYFKHETEAPESVRTIDGVPMVKLNNRSWYENMIVKSGDVTVPTNDASDLYAALQEYTILQQMGMVEMTYEKYLEQYGAKIAKERQGDPEILRFARSWVQPKNFIEPTDGSPSSAWVWADEIKMDKPKKFMEPGFIIGFHCVRPKMFQGNVRASFIGELWGFKDWYPIYNIDDPTAGVRSIQTDSAMFEAGSRTDPSELELLYDHRDLLTQGEAFVNDYTDHPYTLPLTTGLTMNDAATPEDLRGEYPTEADIQALFVGTNENQRKLYYDGIVMCNISGHVTQQTPI